MHNFGAKNSLKDRVSTDKDLDIKNKLSNWETLKNGITKVDSSSAVLNIRSGVLKLIIKSKQWMRKKKFQYILVHQKNNQSDAAEQKINGMRGIINHDIFIRKSETLKPLHKTLLSLHLKITWEYRTIISPG